MDDFNLDDLLNDIQKVTSEEHFGTITQGITLENKVDQKNSKNDGYTLDPLITEYEDENNHVIEIKVKYEKTATEILNEELDFDGIDLTENANHQIKTEYDNNEEYQDPNQEEYNQNYEENHENYDENQNYEEYNQNHQENYNQDQHYQENYENQEQHQENPTQNHRPNLIKKESNDDIEQKNQHKLKESLVMKFGNIDLNEYDSFEFFPQNDEAKLKKIEIESSKNIVIEENKTINSHPSQENIQFVKRTPIKIGKENPLDQKIDTPIYSKPQIRDLNPQLAKIVLKIETADSVTREVTVTNDWKISVKKKKKKKNL